MTLLWKLRLARAALSLNSTPDKRNNNANGTRSNTTTPKQEETCPSQPHDRPPISHFRLPDPESFSKSIFGITIPKAEVKGNHGLILIVTEGNTTRLLGLMLVTCSGTSPTDTSQAGIAEIIDSVLTQTNRRFLGCGVAPHGQVQDAYDDVRFERGRVPDRLGDFPAGHHAEIFGAPEAGASGN